MTDSTQAQAAPQQQQPQTMSVDQAYSSIIARQRDQALNHAAELEVRLAIALQENAVLRESLARSEADLAMLKAADVPVNRAQRRAKK